MEDGWLIREELRKILFRQPVLQHCGGLRKTQRQLAVWERGQRGVVGNVVSPSALWSHFVVHSVV